VGGAARPEPAPVFQYRTRSPKLPPYGRDSAGGRPNDRAVVPAQLNHGSTEDTETATENGKDFVGVPFNLKLFSVSSVLPWFRRGAGPPDPEGDTSPGTREGT
jgi:hypothetical protein